MTGSITPGAPTGDGNKKRWVAAAATAPPLRRDLEVSLQVVLSDTMKRTTTATHFIVDHDAVPTGRQKLWDGSGGVVLALVSDLPFSVDPRTARSVMEVVVDCVRQGIPHDAGQKAVDGTGRKAMGSLTSGSTPGTRRSSLWGRARSHSSRPKREIQGPRKKGF